jgi:FO synthase
VPDIQQNLLVSAAGGSLSDDQCLRLLEIDDLGALMAVAAELRDQGHGSLMSYSRKVFIPLTHLCRDVCHYCTFAEAPSRRAAPYMTIEQVLKVARDGAALGCTEALFTLGEKPELRYRAAREWLDENGYRDTVEYLAAAAEAVWRETGIYPHLNPGTLKKDELARLRPLSPSMGIMLENLSPRLGEKGMPHFGSPDKDPTVRMATLAAAGELSIPFTTGILIGIGETRRERIESLLAIRDLHHRYGHVQEIIIQRFAAKPDTKMADAPEPSEEELLWTLAMTRLIFGTSMSVQAPPNLSPGALGKLIGAGINDWGGVSPLTPDYVNPEAPWPHLDQLAAETARYGKRLVQRLPVYPAYLNDPSRWLDDGFQTPMLHATDMDGFVRQENWCPGEVLDPPAADLNRLTSTPLTAPATGLQDILDRAREGEELSEVDIVQLFRARDDDFVRVADAADQLRKKMKGDEVTYVVNRNINYTNVCYFKCQFCAFSKGKMSENLRGKPYDLSAEEISRRVREGWDRGATEVCMQGGIHPDYTGDTYAEICRIVKAAAPDMHIHAFSPLEIWQGAETLGVSLRDFLSRLKAEGLGTLPGTAAEILDDEVRAILCPDKINTEQWFEVIATAHQLDIPTTATIMFGHVERIEHWARHLLRIRAAQKRAKAGGHVGFTEFVPLPFVHRESPVYLKGFARTGPTFRETVLMHAVARLALHPLIDSIQTSWTKLGPKGAAACLNAGVNDLGGTLMNESISRAAGSDHGQEMPPQDMEPLIRSLGRTPRQRTTIYGEPPAGQIEASFDAVPLSPIINTPPVKRHRSNADMLIRNAGS